MVNLKLVEGAGWTYLIQNDDEVPKNCLICNQKLTDNFFYCKMTHKFSCNDCNVLTINLFDFCGYRKDHEHFNIINVRRIGED